jgi:hypothetical protein
VVREQKLLPLALEGFSAEIGVPDIVAEQGILIPQSIPRR